MNEGHREVVQASTLMSISGPASICVGKILNNPKEKTQGQGTLCLEELFCLTSSLKRDLIGDMKEPKVKLVPNCRSSRRPPDSSVYSGVSCLQPVL